jgi:hypothetical protein
MDSLRYWITEMHVDGYRFDLAPTLARQEGEFGTRSAFFDLVAQDPVVPRAKLIAEPWDVGQADSYDLGRFPSAWREWNGRYRHTMRDFWRSHPVGIGEFATRFCGRADMYAGCGAARPPRSTWSPSTTASRGATWSLTTTSTTRPTGKPTRTAPPSCPPCAASCARTETGLSAPAGRREREWGRSRRSVVSRHRPAIDPGLHPARRSRRWDRGSHDQPAYRRKWCPPAGSASSPTCAIPTSWPEACSLAPGRRQPVDQAGHGLPCARADQRSDHDVARVMHAGVHPGVRHGRRQEP